MATAAYISESMTQAGKARKSTARFYAPELDVLRFAAFMLVYCRHVVTSLGFARIYAVSNTASNSIHQGAAQAFHAPAMSSRWSNLQGALQSLDFGVCLFFFLSSFLITRLLLMEREASGTISIRHFYIRRSLRIWPLYFFFLALMVAASHFLRDFEVSASRVWLSAFFVANWAAVLHGWSSQVIQPLWSVSVEEQFYVIWPNVARFGRQAIIILSLTLTAVAIGTLYYLGHKTGVGVTQVWPNTFVQCLFLSGGALTACLSSPEARRLSVPTRVGLVVSGFVFWVVASSRFHIVRTETPGASDLICGYLLVLLGTFLIFSGVVGWNGRPIPGWLLYLGKISYGLYVFHVACLVLMQLVVMHLLAGSRLANTSPYLTTSISDLLSLPLTLICASLSYRYIELPFLQMKSRFTLVTSRPA